MEGGNKRTDEEREPEGERHPVALSPPLLLDLWPHICEELLRGADVARRRRSY